jgi:hypothetical protein
MYIYSISAEFDNDDSSDYARYDIFDSPKNNSEEYIPDWKIATEQENEKHSEIKNRENLRQIHQASDFSDIAKSE